MFFFVPTQKSSSLKQELWNLFKIHCFPFHHQKIIILCFAFVRPHTYQSSCPLGLVFLYLSRSWENRHMISFFSSRVVVVGDVGRWHHPNLLVLSFLLISTIIFCTSPPSVVTQIHIHTIFKQTTWASSFTRHLNGLFIKFTPTERTI